MLALGVAALHPDTFEAARAAAVNGRRRRRTNSQTADDDMSAVEAELTELALAAVENAGKATNKKRMCSILLHVAKRDPLRRSYFRPVPFTFHPPLTEESFRMQLSAVVGLTQDKLHVAKHVPHSAWPVDRWDQLLPWLPHDPAAKALTKMYKKKGGHNGGKGPTKGRAGKQNHGKGKPHKKANKPAAKLNLVGQIDWCQQLSARVQGVIGVRWEEGGPHPPGGWPPTSINCVFVETDAPHTTLSRHSTLHRTGWVAQIRFGNWCCRFVSRGTL
jgi:hypothetical protein